MYPDITHITTHLTTYLLGIITVVAAQAAWEVYVLWREDKKFAELFSRAEKMAAQTYEMYKSGYKAESPKESADHKKGSVKP